MELVTLGIALLGLLMSAATWLRELLLRRNRISLSVIDFCSYGRKCVQFYLRFHNRSSLPASVSHVTVRIDGAELVCELDQKRIRETSAGYRVDSPAFPLSLPPMSFSAYYLEFLTVQDIPLAAGKTVAFEVHASRGTVAQTISLPTAGHYLQKRVQR